MEPPSRLKQEEIHDVLSNQRRRRALELLQENGDRMTARELSERIAELETGESPAPRNKRQSVYVSLHQTHLPKLNDLHIVSYDNQAKEVTLKDTFGEVASYMDSTPHDRSAWSYLYLVVGLIGGVTVFGAALGTPILSSLPPHMWAYPWFITLIIVALYQTYQQRTTLIRRIRSR